MWRTGLGGQECVQSWVLKTCFLQWTALSQHLCSLGGCDLRNCTQLDCSGVRIKAYSYQRSVPYCWPCQLCRKVLRNAYSAHRMGFVIHPAVLLFYAPDLLAYKLAAHIFTPYSELATPQKFKHCKVLGFTSCRYSGYDPQLLQFWLSARWLFEPFRTYSSRTQQAVYSRIIPLQ